MENTHVEKYPGSGDRVFKIRVIDEGVQHKLEVHEIIDENKPTEHEKIVLRALRPKDLSKSKVVEEAKQVLSIFDRFPTDIVDAPIF